MTSRAIIGPFPQITQTDADVGGMAAGPAWGQAVGLTFFRIKTPFRRNGPKGVKWVKLEYMQSDLLCYWTVTNNE